MTIPDGARVLDIGAGPGPFALPLAERGCDVTVVEPSPVMREALAGGMDERGISNVRVIPKRWEDVTVADLGHGSHEQHGTYHHPPEMAGHQCREEREGVAEPRVKYWRDIMPCIMNSVIHTDVPDAKKALLDICSPVTRAVSVDLLNADNRVVFRDIIAPRDLPHYTSCRGDGYAVVASDTASAGNGLGDPLLIQVKTAEVAAGTCMAVNTGDVLPPGADAVVRLEDTRIECNGIRILAAVKAGDNLGAKGSMVKQGTVIYPGGTLLKPTDIGTLCMFGFTSVRVYNKPRVLIVPTGDEVVEPGRKPGAGMVNEANGIMCSQLVRRWGGNPTLHEIVRDNPAAIADALHEGQDYDLIITTGGTSVGGRDRITGVLSSIGKVLVHFVGVVPGRPMGIGYMDVPGRKIPVLCLPGPVAACATVMFLFAAPAIRKLARLPEPPLPRSMTTLAQDVTGFEGFVRLMKIEIDNGHARIVNIAGDSMGSGTIAYLVKDGDCDGFRKDEPVEAVFLE